MHCFEIGGEGKAEIGDISSSEGALSPLNDADDFSLRSFCIKNSGISSRVLVLVPENDSRQSNFIRLDN
jgi:hypothetical protein